MDENVLRNVAEEVCLSFECGYKEWAQKYIEAMGAKIPDYLDSKGRCDSPIDGYYENYAHLLKQGPDYNICSGNPRLGVNTIADRFIIVELVDGEPVANEAICHCRATRYTYQRKLGIKMRTLIGDIAPFLLLRLLAPLVIECYVQNS